jgi:hypothetical protein
MLMKRSINMVFEELTCNTNRDYQIFEGTSICQHKGMLEGKSAGFTFVTNPSNKKIAQKRPAFFLRFFTDSFHLPSLRNLHPNLLKMPALV